jgi:hypothetical protein
MNENVDMFLWVGWLGSGFACGDLLKQLRFLTQNATDRRRPFLPSFFHPAESLTAGGSFFSGADQQDLTQGLFPGTAHSVTLHGIDLNDPLLLQ